MTTFRPMHFPIQHQNRPQSLNCALCEPFSIVSSPRPALSELVPVIHLLAMREERRVPTRWAPECYLRRAAVCSRARESNHHVRGPSPCRLAPAAGELAILAAEPAKHVFPNLHARGGCRTERPLDHRVRPTRMAGCSARLLGRRILGRSEL